MKLYFGINYFFTIFTLEFWTNYHPEAAGKCVSDNFNKFYGTKSP
jgi:hypothetical protein